MKEYYDRYWTAEGYGPEGGLAPTTRDLLNALVPPGTSVVDLGCGDGRVVGLWAKDRECAYLGLDVADSAIEKTRALGLQAERIDDAGLLPLPDSGTAVVTCIEVLEHLFDPFAAAVEIRRVLAPGGILIASVPNAAYWVRRAELGLLGRFNPYGHDAAVEEPWIDPHVRFFTRGTLTSMLERAGFTSVEVRAGAHAVFSTRTRIESLPPWRAAMKVWPAMLAPALLVAARRPHP